MIYAYHCDSCGHDFDVVKPIAEYQTPETCTRKGCGAPARKEFVPRRVHLRNTAVQEAEYNPGLGCIVKNRQHREELCRIKGVQEIGNEKPETLHRYYDHAREERRERVWAEATKGWVGNE